MLPGIEALDSDTTISLFEISNFNLLVPTETLRFCNLSGVSFQGQEYQAIPVESSSYDLIGQGSMPNPKLVVSNVGRVISNFLYQVKTTPNYRLEGCTVTRRLTQKKFLDNQPSANAAIKEFTPDVFLLEQIEEETYLSVKFRLATAFDIEGQTLPGRMALRSCVWVYRGAECGYFGDAKYTVKNDPTIDPSKDICNKSLAACKLRFGANAVLPFGGMPSLGNFGN